VGADALRRAADARWSRSERKSQLFMTFIL
jgi:hypothetical protein